MMSSTTPTPVDVPCHRGQDSCPDDTAWPVYGMPTTINKMNQMSQCPPTWIGRSACVIAPHLLDFPFTCSLWNTKNIVQLGIRHGSPPRRSLSLGLVKWTGNRCTKGEKEEDLATKNGKRSQRKGNRSFILHRTCGHLVSLGRVNFLENFYLQISHFVQMSHFLFMNTFLFLKASSAMNKLSAGFWSYWSGMSLSFVHSRKCCCQNHHTDLRCLTTCR